MATVTGFAAVTVRCWTGRHTDAIRQRGKAMMAAAA
jgi:hypothetical protein